jgi:hypothetical protein
LVPFAILGSSFALWNNQNDARKTLVFLGHFSKAMFVPQATIAHAMATTCQAFAG